MATYTDICPSQGEAKNTGFDDQCLETKLKIPVLSNGFAFPTLAGFKNRLSWKTAIASKDLVPLFEAYELADASTADKKFESGNFSKVTEKGIEKITFECFLSVCAYSALKSYEENGNYGELFEFNEGDDYSGIYGADGVTVKGRKIESLIVTRMRATKDKVPYVKCEIVFNDKDDVLNAVIVKSDLSADDLEGIHDVQLNLITGTATSATFTATTGCSHDKLLKSFIAANFVVLNAAGVVVPFTLVPANANGVYEVVYTTPLATGIYTLNINGVIVQTDVMYESTGALVVFP